MFREQLRTRLAGDLAELERVERPRFLAVLGTTDGWNVAGPTSTHRRAPLTREPTTSTPAHRTKATSTSVGAASFSRR